MSVTSGSKRSLSHRVYQQVRTSILTAHLQPGQALKPADLCKEYDVSLNVVREALSRLTGEGLVRSQPQIGFTVFAPSSEDLDDLVAVRIEIEGLALRWAIERGDLTWEAQVVAAHHKLRRTPAQDAEGEDGVTSEDWITAHAEFHSALLQGAGSKRLRDLTSTLSDAAQVYRRWSLGLGIEAGRDVVAEHDELAHLTVTRNVDGAVAALTKHISASQAFLSTEQAPSAADRLA